MNRLDMMFEKVWDIHSWFATNFWHAEQCRDLVWLLANRPDFAALTKKHPFYLNPTAPELVSLLAVCAEQGYEVVGVNGPALSEVAGIRRRNDECNRVVP